MMTRRIFEAVIVMMVLWEGAKGTVRLWERKTWAATSPGSPAHAAAELSSIFVG